MIARIRKKYAMTEKGAKDYVAAVFLSVLVNISKMLPVGVLATALSGIVEADVYKRQRYGSSSTLPWDSGAAAGRGFGG